MPQDPVLLEALAGTGWFAKNGEVALTAGLTFCMEKDARATEAFLSLVRRRTGLTEDQLMSPDRWEPESRDDERNRVDIAGWKAAHGHEAPILYIEAKVSADFAPQQISTYVKYQRKLLQGAAGFQHGALIVLVPAARVDVALAEVGVDLERLEANATGTNWVAGEKPRVVVAVAAWDEVLDVMISANGPAGDDLRQLLGACRALEGADVTALTEEDLAGTWLERQEDTRSIIDRVTRGAIVRLGLPVAPWQPNASGGFAGGFRYLAPSNLPNLAVGMRSDRVDPPLWVRWHSHTPDIAEVEARLKQAGHQPIQHKKHLWIPLEIQADKGSATGQIDDLVAEVVSLYKVAVGDDVREFP